MFLRVMGNMIVEAGASIDVDGMGYPSPGDGARARAGDGKNAGGGGHGGKGGPETQMPSEGQAYDVRTDPSRPGSGGGTGRYKNNVAPGGYGGGFIGHCVDGETASGWANHRRRDAIGHNADGQYYQRTEWATGPVGEGQGVPFTSSRQTVPGDGAIAANGGTRRPGRPSSRGSGGGGGGRIALYYAKLHIQLEPFSASGRRRRTAELMQTASSIAVQTGRCVVNGTFAVSIKSPATESKHVAGKMIRFEAAPRTACRLSPTRGLSAGKDDGQPDVDGRLGEGEILQESLAGGKYTITLSGTDASGATSEAKIDSRRDPAGNGLFRHACKRIAGGGSRGNPCNLHGTGDLGG